MGPAALLLATLAVVGPAPELSAHAGALFSGPQHASGLELEPFGVLTLEGRYRPRPGGGFLDRLLVEGGLGGLAPLGGGALGEVVAIGRVGLGFEQLSFSLGAQLRYAPTPFAPLQLFPSLSVAWRPGVWGVRLALFDRISGPVARLAVEYGQLGLAVTPLMGLEAYGRLPLGTATALEVRGFWNALLDSRNGGLTAGLVWTPGFGGGE